MAFVLINHGWTNTRQQDHWQRHAAIQLRLQGHHVNYPQFPDTETPDFTQWSNLLKAELQLLVELRETAQPENSNDQELIFIGHSLGCINFLKSALEGLDSELTIDRALLVAPPDPNKLAQLSSFAIDLYNPELLPAIHKATRNLTLLGSDADPWSPAGIPTTFGEPLKLEPVIIPGAKHLASGDGWGYWQGVIDWVNDPNADLTRR
jgi:hypothetical protein